MSDTIDSAELAGEGLVSRIQAALPGLRPSERRVAEAVIADPTMVARESISALAERCETSAPTVVRFSRRLGFSGYPQLRVALAMAVGIEQGRAGREAVSGTLVPEDLLADLVAKVGRADARAAEETAAGLDLAALERAISLITSARRIDIVGIGSSALTARDLNQKLHRLGLSVWCHTDRHAATTALAVRSTGDLLVAISNSGTTTDVVDIARRAAQQGVKTIAITGQSQSALAKKADAVLLSQAREAALRVGAMASRIAQLVLVDCLFSGVAMRDVDASRRALDASFRAVGEL